MSWHAGSKGPPRPVPAPSDEALSFHRSLPGYAPTPVHDLPAVAAELGLASVVLKDESHRLGLHDRIAGTLPKSDSAEMSGNRDKSSWRPTSAVPQLVVSISRRRSKFLDYKFNFFACRFPFLSNLSIV